MKEEKEKRYWPSSVRYIPAELTKRDQPLTLRDFLLFIIVPSALRSAPRAHLRPPIRKKRVSSGSGGNFKTTSSKC